MSSDQLAGAARKRKIAELANNVRQKYFELKLGMVQQDESLGKLFKPISTPLEEIASNSKKIRLSTAMKNEIKPQKFEDEREEIEKEEDFDELPMFVPEAICPDTGSGKNEKEDGEINNESREIDEEDRESDEVNQEIDEENREIAEENGGNGETRGQIPTQYIQDYMYGSAKTDSMYGPYYDNESTEWYLGRTPIHFNPKTGGIEITDEKGTTVLDGTPGLYELIFYDKPSHHTTEDLANYKRLLGISGVHQRSNSYIKSSKRYKYLNIIKPLFKKRTSAEFIKMSSAYSAEKKKGDGIMNLGKNLPHPLIYNNTPIDYVYWDDPNELCERLKMLMASRHAGNNSHDNEIIAILNELREANIIR